MHTGKGMLFLRQRIDRLSRMDMVIGLLALLYVLFFCRLTFLMYDSYYYHDQDLAIFNQVMWNTLHDGFFHSSILSGGTFFRHQMPSILILFLPLYALFQSPKFLLLLQTWFLAFAVIPLYLLIKDALDEKWACVFSLLYLIHPTVAYTNLYEFHTHALENFFLLFSFYFLRKRRIFPFALFSSLSMICKEDVALVIIMFGIYALTQKFEKKFIIYPIALGIGYLMLIFFLIMPSFGGEGNIFFSTEQYGRYAHLGGSFREILATFVRKPLYLIQYVFTQGKGTYLMRMLTFSGFLPLFSPETLLMILPPLTENLLSALPISISTEYYYSSSIAAFLIVASGLSVKRLKSWIPTHSPYSPILTIFLLLTLLVSGFSEIFNNPILTFSERQDMFIPDKKDAVRDKMIGYIPHDASVMATFNFLPKLSDRTDLYSYHHWYLNGTLNLSNVGLEEGNVEYILMDFDDRYMRNIFKSPEGNERQKNLFRDTFWGIFAISDNIVLLKKNYESPHTYMDIYRMFMEDDEVGKANLQAALWVEANTDKDDIFYATTISSYVQYVSEISERRFLNYTTDKVISKELSSIESPDVFGKERFCETLKNHDVSYLYIFHKWGKSEYTIWGQTRNTIFSKPDIIASQPNVFELVYENDFVRIYRIHYP